MTAPAELSLASIADAHEAAEAAHDSERRCQYLRNRWSPRPETDRRDLHWPRDHRQAGTRTCSRPSRTSLRRSSTVTRTATSSSMRCCSPGRTTAGSWASRRAARPSRSGPASCTSLRTVRLFAKPFVLGMWRPCWSRWACFLHHPHRDGPRKRPPFGTRLIAHRQTANLKQRSLSMSVSYFPSTDIDMRPVIRRHPRLLAVRGRSSVRAVEPAIKHQIASTTPKGHAPLANP